MTEEIVKEYDSEKQRQEKQSKAAAKHRASVEKETKEQVSRWDRTGMLKGIEDEYAQGQMALLLENQRLINEISTDSGDMAQFKRISIPLVRRVFDPTYCLIWHLASLQTMLGPTAFAFFNRPDGEIFEETVAHTKRIKSLWGYPAQDNIREQHNLDKEAAMTALLSAMICDEFNKEVIEDLRNNVGIHCEMQWQGPKALWDALNGLFYRFEHETASNKKVPFGKKPNWIVTSVGLAAELKKEAEFTPRLEAEKPIERVLRNGERISSDWWDKLNCLYTGTFKEIKLIECKNLLPNDVLVGYKEGPLGSGYAWLPYVPFTQTPVVLDPETFSPRRGILTRYGKRLSVNGSQFYARLTVKGHELVAEEKPVEILDIGENVEKSE